MKPQNGCYTYQYHTMIKTKKNSSRTTSNNNIHAIIKTKAADTDRRTLKRTHDFKEPAQIPGTKLTAETIVKFQPTTKENWLL